MAEERRGKALIHRALLRRTLHRALRRLPCLHPPQRPDQRAARRSRRRENASRTTTPFIAQQERVAAGERVGTLRAPSGISLSRAKQSPPDLIRTALIIQAITKRMKITHYSKQPYFFFFFFCVIYYFTENVPNILRKFKKKNVQQGTSTDHRKFFLWFFLLKEGREVELVFKLHVLLGPSADSLHSRRGLSASFHQALPRTGLFHTVHFCTVSNTSFRKAKVTYYQLISNKAIEGKGYIR